MQLSSGLIFNDYSQVKFSKGRIIKNTDVLEDFQNYNGLINFSMLFNKIYWIYPISKYINGSMLHLWEIQIDQGGNKKNIFVYRDQYFNRFPIGWKCDFIKVPKRFKEVEPFFYKGKLMMCVGYTLIKKIDVIYEFENIPEMLYVEKMKVKLLK